jgi:uncharacterized protein YktB (UPF0637 family)
MAKKDTTKAKDSKTKDVTTGEFRLDDWHPEHDKHLCHIVNLRNMKTAAKLAKDAKYICFLCGRAAKKEQNLCEPVKI